MVHAEACAALSPALFDNKLGGGVTAAKAIRHLKTPLLIATSPSDPYSPLAADRELAASAPARVVKFVTLPDAAGHGWDTIADQSQPGQWTPFSDRLIRFLSTNR